MNFHEFLSWSQRNINTVPHLNRLCETRIARAFAALRPEPAIPSDLPAVHRCDLARLWCEVRGLPSTMSRRTLACEGVRHALQLIFHTLAATRAVVAVPADVYPVYSRLAAEARLRTFAFPTFPRFELAEIFADATLAGANIVLLPQPLKLHGRDWTDTEVAIAEEWLRSAPERRLILDGIYNLGLPLERISTHLIATDQVLFLDSLSKGWLHEQVFGVAIVPEQDLTLYSTMFRDLVPSPLKLFLARELLTRSPNLPHRLTDQMNKRREELLDRVSLTHSRTLPCARGYFVAVEANPDVLLAEHSLLTIPATVFGSRCKDWSIASALPELPELDTQS